MTSTEIILAIANVVFIIIAIFLFVRLRKTGKKSDTETKQQPELADVTNITQDDFKPEMFGIRKQDIAPSEKPVEAVSKVKIGQEEKTALILEDELPEVEEKPAKKESKKKKAAKKILDEVIEKAIVKETGVQPEKALTPEKEEKPEKKETKKKKPPKKEPEKADAIKEKIGASSEKIVIPEKIEFKFEETIPEKEEKPEIKEGKKKKPSKKEEIVEEVVIEEPKSPKKKAAEPPVKTKAGKETVKVKKVEEKAAKKPSKKKK